jgi:hypothetical protein
MPDTSVVKRFYDDGKALTSLAAASNDPSSFIFAQDLFRKALLLAIASYFERRVTESVLDVIAGPVPLAHPTRQFCQNKALKRQYHTLFQWDGNNANHFFAFFGSEFRDVMVARVRDTPGMADSIVAFLQLGRLRNEMVHGNFEAFIADDTADELFEKFRLASRFVDVLPEALADFIGEL